MYCAHRGAVPETARIVAKAFYEGRKCRRGNCETDGSSYLLYGNEIARRIRPEDIPDATAAKLSGVRVRRPLEFSFGGWPTKTTARHLCALGVRAEVVGIRDPIAKFNGIEVSHHSWYTPDEIARLAPPSPAVKPPRFPAVKPPRFVNLTLPLFA